MTPKNPDRPMIPYARQSRSRERSISVEEQIRDVERWATQAGWGWLPLWSNETCRAPSPGESVSWVGP